MRRTALFAPLSRLVIAGCLALQLSGCAWQPPVYEDPGLLDAQLERHSFPLLSDSEVLGTPAVLSTQQGDTLPDIARHFGLGLQAVTDANPGVDAWLPPVGSQVRLPLRFILPDAPRRGIVVNLPAMRMFYFPANRPDGEVQTYPVGIGREGWSTPQGSMAVVDKAAGPTWFVPESVRREHAQKGDPLPAAVPPGPDNPLGQYALYLNRSSYLIHGTHKPYGVGLRVSHGCMRLYPENIERLFRDVAVRTPVHVVNEPYLLGRRSGQWYLEAHPPLDESNEKALRRNLMTRLKKIAAKEPGAVDWGKVDAILVKTDGIPSPIVPPAAPESWPVVRHPAYFYGAPEPAVYEPGRWYVNVLEGRDEAIARRMAAMIIHQGPPIPALVRANEGGYAVLAGPFPDAATAKKTRDRLQREFEMRGLSILEPGRTS